MSRPSFNTNPARNHRLLYDSPFPTKPVMTQIRLPQPARLHLIELATQHQYIPLKSTTPTEQQHARGLSLFINYALTHLSTQPYQDTRPPHLKPPLSLEQLRQYHATAPHSLQELNSYSTTLSDDYRPQVRLYLTSQTHAFLHQLALTFLIPITSRKAYTQPLPAHPNNLTTQAVLEAIGLQFLTPDELPDIPQHLAPTNRYTPPKWEMTW